jgi:hypothetical protein
MRKGFRCGRLERKATSVNASFCQRQRTVRPFVYSRRTRLTLYSSQVVRAIERREVEHY